MGKGASVAVAGAHDDCGNFQIDALVAERLCRLEHIRTATTFSFAVYLLFPSSVESLLI